MTVMLPFKAGLRHPLEVIVTKLVLQQYSLNRAFFACGQHAREYRSPLSLLTAAVKLWLVRLCVVIVLVRMRLFSPHVARLFHPHRSSTEGNLVF